MIRAALLLLFVGCVPPPTPGVDAGVTPDAGQVSDGGWQPMFNGTDFTGWETYLGPPNGQTVPVGLNSPTQNVFSVVQVDGRSAIHVTGEIWGVLATLKEYENFDLRLEFKWGPHAPWPPLTAIDSGLMIHSIGPHGAVKAGGGALAVPANSGWFLQSLECQIAANDTGSFYTLGDNTVENAAHQPVRSIGKSADNELPHGEWNTLEIISAGGKVQHLVNGKLTASYENPRSTFNGVEGPLTKGRIQLQSESGEIYFAKVELRVLP